MRPIFAAIGTLFILFVAARLCGQEAPRATPEPNVFGSSGTAAADVAPSLDPAAPAASAENPSPERGTKIFLLRHAQAFDAEQIVKQLFPPHENYSVAADVRSNALIMRGDPRLLAEIQAIINSLDQPAEQPKAATASTPATDKRPASSVLAPGATASRQVVGSLANQYESKEQRAAELARQIREAQAAPQADKARLEKLTADLRKVVGEVFAARQELHRAEAAHLQQRLAAIQQNVNTRERLGEQIIDRRVKDLLNPDTQWDSTPHAPRDDSSTRSATRTSSDSGTTMARPKSTPIPNIMFRGVSIDSVISGVLGVKVQAVTGETLSKAGYRGGLLIEEIGARSPANDLRVGDVIVGLHNWETTNQIELAWTLLQPISKNLTVLEATSRSTEEEAILRYVRDGQPGTTKVVLPPWPPEIRRPPLKSSSPGSPKGQSESKSSTSTASPADTDLAAARAHRDKLRERMDVLQQQYKAGTVSFLEMMRAGLEFQDAEIAASATPQGKQALRREKVETLKEIKMTVERLHRAGRATQTELLTAEAEVLKAEAELAADEAKEKEAARPQR